MPGWLSFTLIVLCVWTVLYGLYRVEDYIAEKVAQKICG